MTTSSRGAVFAMVGLGIVLAWASSSEIGGRQGAATLTIDPAASQVSIAVGKSGLFGFAGHDHEVLAPAVSGRVTFDPADWPHATVTLAFDAAKLTVTGKGDPPADVPKVQEVMLGADVLDVKQYATIAFKSRRVTAAAKGPAIDLTIEGDLTLHGVTRPLTVRASASLEPAGITARGGFAFKQTDFGMHPVTAGGGTVRVKDELIVQFVLVAKR